MTELRVERYGLGVRVPPGWDARLLRRPASVPGETVHPVLHLGSFRMPLLVEGDYGSHLVGDLRSHDVFVALKEFDPSLRTSALFDHAPPWPLVPADANPMGLQRVLRGQSGIQRFFTVRGRAFCLYAVLGSHARRHTGVPLVNQALHGLQIAQAHPSHAALGR